MVVRNAVQYVSSYYLFSYFVIVKKIVKLSIFEVITDHVFDLPIYDLLPGSAIQRRKMYLTSNKKSNVTFREM